MFQGSLYLVGGSTGASSNNIVSLDQKSNTWSMTLQPSQPRHLRGAAAEVGGKLYLVGGYSDTTGWSNPAEAFNPPVTLYLLQKN